MTIHKEVLELAFKTHSKNERHRTLLETRYWCDQYKLLAKTAIKALAQPERHELQADGKHPAPCARFCEANAFQIEIRRLKAQLAQPEPDDSDINQVHDGNASIEQQPVAWMYEFYADMGHKGLAFEEQRSAHNTPLYTTPPQRTWVGLTDDEREAAMAGMDNRWDIAEAIEDELKEKNT